MRDVCNEAIPFRPYCEDVVTRTRNVIEYMLVLALCLVMTVGSSDGYGVSWKSVLTSVTSSRLHPSYDDCLEDKRRLSGLFCAVLCTTVVHNDTHTYEQFLKMSVRLGLGPTDRPHYSVSSIRPHLRM